VLGHRRVWEHPLTPLGMTSRESRTHYAPLDPHIPLLPTSTLWREQNAATNTDKLAAVRRARTTFLKERLVSRAFGEAEDGSFLWWSPVHLIRGRAHPSPRLSRVEKGQSRPGFA